ncbi:MAG: SHOCT domain-containing protein [Candidatus Bathyarchaeia archaeon]
MAERSVVGVAIVLALLLIGLFFVLPILGMRMMSRGMMGDWDAWGYRTGVGWGFMFAGILIRFLFIALLIVGAYFLLTHREHADDNEKALSILNERYAKGELTEKQYLEMKEHLTKK